MASLDSFRRLVLSSDAWALLRTVNRDANLIDWQADEQTWGIEDRWPLPADNGKLQACDGAVLWKVSQLMQNGVPNSPLLFTLCTDDAGAPYAVLCVTTDRGDYILDPRFDDLITYDDLKSRGYNILYRSSIGGKLDDLWEKIKELR